MPRTRRQAPLEDIYDKIQISDFAGGLVTAIGALSLAQNMFPACLNIIPLVGRVLFRGGWSVYSTIPAQADAAFYFKDADKDPHFAVWAGGTLYDCYGGSAIVVEAAIYTAGQNIGYVVDNGILYWSTGQPNPVPMRYWDPSLAVAGPVVGNLVPAGSVDPPASDFLLMNAGSIVALAPTWGSPSGPDVYQPTVYCWADVNDPTTWIATNSQQVGSRDGGRLEYGRLFGVSADGISPTGTMLIFRDDLGVYAYKGALGEQEEELLNCEVGIRDRQSAQWMPTKQEFGVLVWLGTDGQFWKTTGFSCLAFSADTILPTLTTAYHSALAASSNPRFPSGYNQQWQYYWCSVGDVQFVWRWSIDSWTLFQGWPIGPSFIAPDANGIPANFIASKVGVTLDPFTLDESDLGGIDVLADTDEPQTVYVLAQVAKIGDSDLGVMPSVYWRSPVLHGGDFGMFKQFHWARICVLDTGALYNVTARSIARSDGSIQATRTLALQAPNNTGNPFILNQSTLGGTDVLADPVVQALVPGQPVSLGGRLAVAVPVSEWWPEGNYESLEGCGMQLEIAYGGGTNAFDLLGAEIDFLQLGTRRGSGTLYNPEDITDAPFDPLLGWLNPVES